MHSFSAMRKVEKEKKNTSPRTAPAMSCSRLKTGNGIRVSFGGGANPTSGNFLHFRKANLREFCFIHTWPIFLGAVVAYSSVSFVSPLIPN